MATTMRTAEQAQKLWALPTEELALPADHVHVWRAALDLPAPALRDLHQTLAPEEADRAARIRDLARRDRFIAAHGLLRAILCRYLGAEPRQLRIVYGPCGKPALAPTSRGLGLTFNLAHSHGLALFAIARDRELGVDIEHLREAGAWERVARRCLAASERAALAGLPPEERCAAFFSYWTCKEAFLKAVGAGLSRPLGQLVIAQRADGLAVCGDAGTNWSVQPLPLDRDYVAALVVEGHGWQLRCWKWPRAGRSGLIGEGQPGIAQSARTAAGHGLRRSRRSPQANSYATRATAFVL